MKKSKVKFVINGMYHRGGQERAFFETMRELDKLAQKDEIEILIPENVEFEDCYTNIRVARHGKRAGILWLQVLFPIYVLEKRAIGVHLFNNCPILKPDIASILDLTSVIYKPNKKTIKRRLGNFYLDICRRSIIKSKNPIITVSETSKKDIVKYFDINANRIINIGNGWQHIDRITENPELSRKYPELKEREFYFSLSSLASHKNFKWVHEVAKRNRSSIFAIAGASTNSTDQSIDAEANVVYLGRVSDEDMKGLMRTCKAFLFPSYYEGFGIPPLEALAVGTPIIISNRSCLPEIYEDAAHYIDPDNYDVDLDEILTEKVSQPEKVLNKYSWKKTASILYNAMNEYER